jgi:hypothetical protein
MKFRSETVRVFRNKLFINGNEYLVSTVLPTDRDHYETMAFGPGISDELDYTNNLEHIADSEEEAALNHQRVIELITYFAKHGTLPHE